MHKLDTAQQHPGGPNQADPQHRTQNIPQVKLTARVRRNTGRQRHERAHNRHETPQHQRHPAALSEKLLSRVQVLSAQKLRVILEQVTSVTGAQLVPHLAASDGGNNQHRERQPQRKPHTVMQHAESKNKRITRQNREQHAGLNKHDDRRDHQHPRAGANKNILKIKTEKRHGHMRNQRRGEKRHHNPET